MCSLQLGQMIVSTFINTQVGSPNSRYVKSFVRGFRCGITAARSFCHKLQMLSATMNRVPASKWDKLHGTILHTSEGNCSDLRGSGDYSASCGGTTKHGISSANRFRPLKREQLPARSCRQGGNG